MPYLYTCRTYALPAKTCPTRAAITPTHDTLNPENDGGAS